MKGVLPVALVIPILVLGCSGPGTPTQPENGEVETIFEGCFNVRQEVRVQSLTSPHRVKESDTRTLRVTFEKPLQLHNRDGILIASIRSARLFWTPAKRWHARCHRLIHIPLRE